MDLHFTFSVHTQWGCTGGLASTVGECLFFTRGQQKTCALLKPSTFFCWILTWAGFLHTFVWCKEKRHSPIHLKMVRICGRAHVETVHSRLKLLLQGRGFETECWVTVWLYGFGIGPELVPLSSTQLSSKPCPTKPSYSGFAQGVRIWPW